MNKIKISPKGTNMTGHYRECSEVKCKNLVACPFVKCQSHRTDFAVNDYEIPTIITID